MIGPQGMERLEPGLAAAPLQALDLGMHNLDLVRASLDTRRALGVAEFDTGGVEVTSTAVRTAQRIVPLRIYRGTTAAHPPVLVYFHSGALVLGNLDTDHARCVTLARHAQCVVASVDYRLAPEAPFPAALDDCVGVLEALGTEPNEFRIDPARIAVGGSSAGAGLAAAVALHARDHRGPRLRFQLLHQPMLDATCSTPSMLEFASTPGFDAGSARYAWSSYLQGRPVTPYASAQAANDLGGLPPAHIVCSELDPLRDEAIEYAQRLARASVPTELHLLPGTCHGFDSLVPSLAVSIRTLAEQAAALADGFARPVR